MIEIYKEKVNKLTISKATPTFVNDSSLTSNFECLNYYFRHFLRFLYRLEKKSSACSSNHNVHVHKTCYQNRLVGNNVF